MKQIDARGRACPEPVMMTKQALKESPEGVEVQVDSVCAADNITRFAEGNKYRVTRRDGDGEYVLTLTRK